MFRGKLKILTLALMLLMSVASTALAQGTRAKSKPAQKAAPKPSGETLIVSRADGTAMADNSAGLTGTQDELTRATEVYKSSLRDLLVLRERRVTEAAEQLEKLRELYKDGIISRREFEETEKALTELKGQVAEVQQKIIAADQMLAEALLESEAANAPLAVSSAPMAGNTSVKRVAYIRFAGSGNWSLSEAAKIEGFFYSRTGRHLPVSAYGQSDLHNRWGYDHRNAMDVAVHPDSPDGQALLSYLTSQRIPFQAFRQAVSGSATGPHIHIGRPSSKPAAKSGWVQQ
ncbi:MAG TPA: hypothetical protein VM911_07195 [Pyrinomonadaceae bacterium]|jgi:hypothetical protein|nr:hypothetical protein [Pyrinomonadaceae bacterium]